MKLHSTRIKVAAFVVLLIVGGVVAYGYSVLNRSRYDDSGFGTFYGFFHAKLMYFSDEPNSVRGFSSTIKGSSPPRWHWIRPTNYQYPSLDFTWFGEAGEGTGQISTASMTLQLPDREIALSQASLSELFFDKSQGALEPADLAAVNFVQETISNAALGRLKPPKHHGYHFEKPVFGSLHHFSQGSRYPYSLYWWLALWATLCLGIGVQHRRKAMLESSPKSPP